MNDISSVVKSITASVFDSITTTYNDLKELALAIISSTYNFAIKVANDPVVIYITRALIVEPIAYVADLFGSIYLGVYAFVTHDLAMFLIFMTTLYPIADYFTVLWQQIVILYYIVATYFIRYVLGTFIFPPIKLI